MSFIPRAMLCRRLLFALCLASVWGGGELKGQLPTPPDKLRIEYHLGPGAPMSIRGYDGYHAYLVDSVSVSGKTWVGLVRVSSPYHGSIAFPALRQGEVVPMFGSLYRVESAAPLELSRLKADEVPKGMTVEQDSVVIPLMRDETGSGQIVYPTAPGKQDWKTIFVVKIDVVDDKTAEPVARIKFEDIRKEPQTLRRGDRLKLGETEWIVRAVVPAGGQGKAFGWVELGPKKKGRRPLSGVAR